MQLREPSTRTSAPSSAASGKEVVELKTEREILRKATAYFATAYFAKETTR